ncbi:hypothetical protein BDR05DRAFT_969630 [Suillus weaverae]|nr:hypothetical protein BDR05DRAFT_969630 [Suillus weaverae]
MDHKLPGFDNLRPEYNPCIMIYKIVPKDAFGELFDSKLHCRANLATLCYHLIRLLGCSEDFECKVILQNILICEDSLRGVA